MLFVREPNLRLYFLLPVSVLECTVIYFMMVNCVFKGSKYLNVMVLLFMKRSNMTNVIKFVML